MPTWKRLGIVNSLIWYRNNVRKTDKPSLEVIRAKLQERLARERLEKEDVPIEDVVGEINPREPDVNRTWLLASQCSSLANEPAVDIIHFEFLAAGYGLID